LICINIILAEGCDFEFMEAIVTFTANPAIDVCTSAEEIAPARKLRCAAARRDAGGGGINVARVARRLGSEVAAIYPTGGSTGALLERLVEREGIRSLAIAVAQETREDFTVSERTSGNQYRFVLPGSPLAGPEWHACLDALKAMDKVPPYVVCSGSLPPGVPDDFYACTARIAKARGAKVVVDTSGDALAAALKGGVYLVKPNLRELQELAHAPLSDLAERIAACRNLIKTSGAEVVALTLGASGAPLVTRDAAHLARSPPIKPVSAVGAGDSFVGGMVWSLAAGHGILDAFRYGVAAGSAAVLNPGTELCHAGDVTRLYEGVELVCLRC
jgi:6-phosphofructokinase 2